MNFTQNMLRSVVDGCDTSAKTGRKGRKSLFADCKKRADENRFFTDGLSWSFVPAIVSSAAGGSQSERHDELQKSPVQRSTIQVILDMIHLSRYARTLGPSRGMHHHNRRPMRAGCREEDRKGCKFAELARQRLGFTRPRRNVPRRLRLTSSWLQPQDHRRRSRHGSSEALTQAPPSRSSAKDGLAWIHGIDAPTSMGRSRSEICNFLVAADVLRLCDSEYVCEEIP